LPVAAAAQEAVADTADRQDAVGPQSADADSLEFKSGYEDVVVGGGATSVGADLQDDDSDKNPLLGVNVVGRVFDKYYVAKRWLNKKLRLSVGLDYSFLNQWSNFSETDTQAASGIFRIFGTWRVFGSKQKLSGNIVYRFENRHLIGSGITPRDLGFDGGSSLSTATFKEFGWGWTSLYWKQTFKSERYGIVLGTMDPGDFSDTYVMLTAYKAFMNDAYFNNPTVALPQQGLGVTGWARFLENWYVSGGLHDANGSPTSWGFDTFFEIGELYTWAEAGWVPGDDALPGEGIHVNVWRQDARESEGTEDTWGVTFSANPVFGRRHARLSPFIRFGYSREDGGQLVRLLLAGGAGVVIRRSDLAGLATSWSGPVNSSLRNQVTTEAFYRLQLFEHLQVTPNIQFTINPSETLETDALWIVSVLRMRLSF
jgi:porin